MKFQADILIQSDATRCTAYVNSSETVLPRYRDPSHRADPPEVEMASPNWTFPLPPDPILSPKP